MTRYADYAPTPYDRRGAFLPERQDWIVAPVGRNRDSGVTENSNFAVALRQRDVSDTDTETPVLAPETPEKSEPDAPERTPHLQGVHDRQAEERETFLNEQQMLASSLESQWQEDRAKALANIDTKLAAQRQKEYEDVMLRKRRKPANLNEEMTEFWELLQTRNNPYRALSRKKTREKFWFELQPVLDERDALVRKEALRRFDARIGRERRHLHQQQADELAQFEARQSTELYEAQREIAEDEARQAREAERRQEIERQLRERDLQRQRDKDRDR